MWPRSAENPVSRAAPLHLVDRLSAHPIPCDWLRRTRGYSSRRPLGERVPEAPRGDPGGRRPVNHSRDASRHEGFEPGVAVPRIVAEFVETKVRDRASDRYVQCIKHVLGKFSESFPGGIDEVTARQVEEAVGRR